MHEGRQGHGMFCERRFHAQDFQQSSRPEAATTVAVEVAIADEVATEADKVGREGG